MLTLKLDRNMGQVSYEGIAKIFEETADNEKAHAERLMSFMKGEPAIILESYSVPELKNTAANLEAAATGEHYEGTDMYSSFEKIARAKARMKSPLFSKKSAR